MLSDLDARLREWRHHLHQNPEVGFAETATSVYIADLLTSFGLSPQRGIGGTGVVASLSLGSGIGAVGLRADMDALPLLERAEHAYGSRSGRMHACGHDGHMAMLLGAAAVLAAEGGFDGTVRFIFQPAEEHGRGAQAMIEDGLLERFGVDAIYGLHNLPGLPTGHVHTRPGPIMASEDTFEITVTGRGGHAARPQMVIDPLVVGAEIVLALQTIVSRSLDPASAAVVSCTEFVTDGIRNAIPGTVTIRGDARTFDPNVQDLVERRLREICAGICVAHGATCSVTYRHEFVPTVNDPVCVDAAATAATAVVGRDQVDPSCAPIMASEDFAIFAQRVPACFAFLGNGTEPGAGGEPLHSSGYDFNDDILTTGAAYYVELVRTVLPESD
jgi:amidohydrolase